MLATPEAEATVNAGGWHFVTEAVTAAEALPGDDVTAAEEVVPGEHPRDDVTGTSLTDAGEAVWLDDDASDDDEAGELSPSCSTFFSPSSSSATSSSVSCSCSSDVEDDVDDDDFRAVSATAVSRLSSRTESSASADDDEVEPDEDDDDDDDDDDDVDDELDVEDAVDGADD